MQGSLTIIITIGQITVMIYVHAEYNYSLFMDLWLDQLQQDIIVQA